MADIIQLLPDAIANQIAAGEVVQRPASVVKELMENAVDAGAQSIKLIVKDAGKTLIQVIDDGCGMSETDARMSFERHATSKIRQSKDLFAIRTMGFRGEALASIGAIAHVEMRTRPHDNELGTRIVVEGSEIKTQELCQCVSGTSISVKNLFYNVPARRNFLKSDTAEMKHVMDEFQRVAMAYPDLFFSLHHNGNEIYHLSPSSLRQRVVSLLGHNSNKKLVPVREDNSDAVQIMGFVGKPEFAKKTRGEQYFFVNKRFIKSSYLNHAVRIAFDDLLPEESYPLYVLFIEIDPTQIDINVHPTKQEIKFEDDRLVYNYVKVSVRHALGRHNITPSLDFEQEMSFRVRPDTPSSGSSYQPPNIESGSSNTPNWSFATGDGDSVDQDRQKTNLENWKLLFDELTIETEEEASSGVPEEPASITIASKATEDATIDDEQQSFTRAQKEPYQVHGRYIINHIKSGYILIDQQAAHERILYEQYVAILENTETYTQRELFARNIELGPADAELLREILPFVNQLGFEIDPFGQTSFVVQGVPTDIGKSVSVQQVIETLLDQYKSNLELQLPTRDNLARAMAQSASIKRGQSLSVPEMKSLIDQLFACAMPFKSPSGRQCFLSFDLEDLEKRFQSS